jgi:hypothetical protein
MAEKRVMDRNDKGEWFSENKSKASSQLKLNVWIPEEVKKSVR